MMSRGWEYITGLAVLIILLILLVNQCSEPSVIKKVERYTDTTYIAGIPDTIHFTDTIERIVEVKITDTVYQEYDKGDSTLYNITDFPFEDSLVKGSIYTKIYADTGMIKYQEFRYVPKFPQYITRVDTLKIKDSIVVTKAEEPKIQPIIGGGIGGSKNLFNFSVSAGLRTKDGQDVFYSYSPIFKSHSITFLTPLNFGKDNNR